MKKIIYVLVVSIVFLGLAFQNCNKQNPFEASSTSSPMLEILAKQSFVIESVYDANQNQIEKVNYNYEFLGKTESFNKEYPYAIGNGPRRDCNRSGTYCKESTSGVVECLSISTLMGCPCSNDVSGYYFIPNQFKIEFLDTDRKRIKIIDTKDSSYAILISKQEVQNFEAKEPKEVCDQADSPL